MLVSRELEVSSGIAAGTNPSGVDMELPPDYFETEDYDDDA